MQKFFIRMSALSISFWLLSCAQPKTADLIIYNGNIITVDENLPRAQAVAIKDEKILAVGSDAKIDRLRGKSTAMIDLQSKTVVPGLVDGHLHFARLGAGNSHIVELDDTRSLEEALALPCSNRTAMSRTPPV